MMMSKKNGGYTQAQLDHKANQSNPNSSVHKAVVDNRANQLNPNNKAYTPKKEGK